MTLIVTVLHCPPLTEMTYAAKLLNWGFAMDGKVTPVGTPGPPAAPRTPATPCGRTRADRVAARPLAKRPAARPSRSRPGPAPTARRADRPGSAL